MMPSSFWLKMVEVDFGGALGRGGLGLLGAPRDLRFERKPKAGG
jgi:hypothetical protein